MLSDDEEGAESDLELDEFDVLRGCKSQRNKFAVSFLAFGIVSDLI